MFEHLAVRGVPGAFAFHPANGAYRKPVEAARLKALGVRPGVPDVIVIYRGKTYAIELKAESGRATAAQLQAIEDIRAAGGNAQVCCGLDCAIATARRLGAASWADEAKGATADTDLSEEGSDSDRVFRVRATPPGAEAAGRA